MQRPRFSFFREAQIWYSREPDQHPLSDQFEKVILLSDEFYRKITAHPIPADLGAVNQERIHLSSHFLPDPV